MKPGTTIPSGRDVLVVEDEERLRTMLSQALKQIGFDATLVPNAESAIKVMSQRTFDILILDLNLTGMDGMEFLESVRRKQCDIQVIILTGFGDLDAARRAIHLDVVDFLTKPCTLGNLELALDRARKRRRETIVESSPGASQEEADLDAAEEEHLNQASANKSSLEEMEMRHIISVLRKHEGNRAAMAAELGISLRKLYYRLNEYQKKGLI